MTKHDTHGAPPTKVHVGPADASTETGKKAGWMLWLVGIVALLLIIWFFFMRDDADAAMAPAAIAITDAATPSANNLQQ